MDQRPAPLEDSFAAIPDAVADIRAGKHVVVVDTGDGHGLGGLTLAAEHATPESINFMLREARGPLYLCLGPRRCEALGLSGVGGSSLRSGAAFMVTIDVRQGIASGVSAEDRASTIRAAADPASAPSDFVYPGHLPVLRARDGGVLERARQTEATVDLARLAGLEAAGVFALILNDDGTAASGADLTAWGARHGVKLASIGDLVRHRRTTERFVERVVSVRMPTSFGEFTAVAFRDLLTGEQHVAMVKGTLEGGDDVLVRVHTQCLLGDVFHSATCDCSAQLEAALARVQEAGKGVVLYLSRPARGLGLLWDMAAADSLAASPVARSRSEETDVRDYGVGSQILVELGITRVRALTDHPRDMTGTELYGLKVVEQVPLHATAAAGDTREHHQPLHIDGAVFPR